MIDYLTLAVACAILLALFLGLMSLSRVPPTPGTAPGPALDASVYARLAELEIKVAALPSLWEEERSRAERAAERARVASRRAAARLEAAEDEEGELPAGDGLPSGGSGLQPLSTLVGGPPPDAVPEYLRRAQALGYPWSFLGRGREG